jgi:hypothetical protein
MGGVVVLSGMNTHELRDGDVVLTHGMRVRISGDGEVSTSHPQDVAGAPCLWWAGVVENLDDVHAAGVVPRSFVRDGLWTVQGNGLARWTVERVDDDSAIGCGWFLGCRNMSVGYRHHPILGDVPACGRCKTL